MPTLRPAPIRRRKLADEVLERLIDLIQQGELRPGEQMPSERDLMATFAVGRAAVREALQALAGMGMISIQHGERARITAVTAQSMIDQIDRSARHLLSTSPGSVEHLKEARLLFEVDMTRIAARKATTDDVARLQEKIALMEENLGNHQAFIEADMDFHKTLAAISENPIFSAVSQAMLQWLAEYHVDVVSVPGAEDVTLGEHREILQSVAAHDADAAERAMVGHLTRASALYQERRRRSR